MDVGRGEPARTGAIAPFPEAFFFPEDRNSGIGREREIIIGLSMIGTEGDGLDLELSIE